MRKPLTLTLVAAAGLATLILIAQAQQPGAEKGAAKGGIEGKLTWFDRQGNVVGTAGESGLYRTMSISRDGKSVAFERTDPQSGNRDIWLLEFSRGTSSRFTADPGWDAFPTWSPDGRRLIFTSNRAGQFDLYQKEVGSSGEGELLYKSQGGKGPTSWSPDGRTLLYYSIGAPIKSYAFPLAPGVERVPVGLTDPEFNSVTARFSPDGRWVAYTSNESGMNEVSVRPFAPDTGAPVAGSKYTVISKGGGRTPLWRGDGKEIFYMTSDGTATTVEVETGSGVKIGTPKPLFKVPAGVLFWDVAPDGARFLMPAPQSAR